ncbi:hypothetical protein D3C71_1703710 [compost metagenome]
MGAGPPGPMAYLGKRQQGRDAQQRAAQHVFHIVGAQVQPAEDNARHHHAADRPGPGTAQLEGQPEPDHHGDLRMAAGQAEAVAHLMVHAQGDIRARVLPVILEPGVEQGGQRHQNQQAEEDAAVPGPVAQRQEEQDELLVTQQGEEAHHRRERVAAQGQHPVQAVQQFVHGRSLWNG